MSCDPNQLNELIRSRRSVLPPQFVPNNPIDDSIIWEILENANWAPSHKLSQPWRFTVFSGEGLNKLGEYQAERYKLLAGSNFKQEKFVKMLTQPLMCSHIIAICMKRIDRTLPEFEEMAAVACAVQNIYLSVSAYGLGGYWSTGGVTFDEGAKSYFNLDEEDKIMGFFLIGHVHELKQQGRRTPIYDKVNWIK